MDLDDLLDAADEARDRAREEDWEAALDAAKQEADQRRGELWAEANRGLGGPP